MIRDYNDDFGVNLLFETGNFSTANIGGVFKLIEKAEDYDNFKSKTHSKEIRVLTGPKFKNNYFWYLYNCHRHHADNKIY